MSGRITADEASALREGITPGAWDAGAGLLYAGYDACPRHGVAPPDRTHGCTCRAIGDIYRDEDRALCAAAPDLAATVIAQAAEIERLTWALERAHHAVRKYGPQCSHPDCNSLAPLRCDDCGARFCDAHDEGGEGHNESASDRHAVGPDDLMAGAAMRSAEASR